MQTAVIIGGSSGVGAGLSQALLRRGYQVIVGDQQSPNLDGVKYQEVDATNSESIKKFDEQLMSHTNKIDLLAVTIGAIDEASIIGISPEKWLWMLQSNLVSSASLVDKLLPYLLKSDASKILLSSSGSGFGTPDPSAKLGLYSVTKHAMVGYFLSLRSELEAHKIPVSLLLPSAVAGKLAQNSATVRSIKFNETIDISKGAQPQGRVLIDPFVAGEHFAKQWLNGLALVTNDPSLLASRILTDRDWFKAELNKAAEIKI